MNPQEPRDLLKVDAKALELYERFSLAHLTAYSVHWLTAWGIPTTYENISVINARLFPRDFTLSGFPELPDAMRSNRTLLQMRPKYRGFATSDPRKGVYLTEKGRDAVAQLISAIGSPTFEGKAVDLEPDIPGHRRSSNQDRTFNPAQLIQDRKKRLLYRRYTEGKLDDAEVVHLLGLLGLYDHTRPVEVRLEFRRLRDAAAALHDEEFVGFLDAVNAKFRTYLDRPDSSNRKD